MARGEPLYRQWRLLKTLQAHRFGISVDELSERMACTKRTVQRDLKVLQDVGFPVRHEERDFGKRFWTLAGGFIESRDLALSMTEMLSLYLSQQLLAPLTGTQFGDGLSSALQKIKDHLSRKALNHFAELEGTILVKSLASQDYSAHDKEIRILNDAIVQQKALRLTYHSASKDRDITTSFHPYGIVLFGASLYCIGWLAEYEEIRTLKVSRMKGVERTDKTFERPTTFSLAAYTRGAFGVFKSGEFQAIRVRFTGWAATNVREQRWHTSQAVVKDDGHALTAEFELASTVEFKRWLLGFGRCAVVLKPRKLAEEIAAELAEAAAAYARS